MSNNTSSVVSKVWSFCNPLRDVGAGYSDFGSQLTIDKIVEAINQSSQQAETLRQSILKKTFKGKLICLNYDSDDAHETRIAAELLVFYKKQS